MAAPAPPAPPAPPKSPASKASIAVNSSNVSISRGRRDTAHKIGIYGPGGGGKSTLAALLGELGIDPLFVDIEEGSNFLDVARIEPTPMKFEDLVASIRLAATSDFGAIVIDSLTKAEELAVDYTLRTVKTEKGNSVDSVEGYGFGKGYVHVYETFLLLLSELDAVCRKGKHVVCICHDCTANVPNPSGEDYIRYEPRLQSPPSGKGSIRHRFKEWCDHLLYIGFDVAVDKDGKAKGSGTRTIYPTEQATHWAKSRVLNDPVPYRKGSCDIWRQMLGK